MMDDLVPDLYKLAFMPGAFRCPQCGFRLQKTCLNAETGEAGTREQERESEPCPNDGVMLVHVTYKEQLEDYSDRLKEEFDTIDKLKLALENCYILARRQRRNFADDTADAISWDHIIRFCEAAGCKSSILR